MILAVEFLAIPSSAVKIASKWRCAILVHSAAQLSSMAQGPLNGGGGGFKRGGVSRSGLVLPFLSFLGLP